MGSLVGGAACTALALVAGEDRTAGDGDGDGDGDSEGLCPFNLLAICMSS